MYGDYRYPIVQASTVLRYVLMSKEDEKINYKIEETFFYDISCLKVLDFSYVATRLVIIGKLTR